MKFRTTFLFLFVVFGIFAQDKKSKGDLLFYGYAYKDAIKEYKKQQINTPLTNQQTLNLADAYYMIGNYSSAADAYVQVYKKDTTMSDYHFNKMLEAMSRTSDKEKMQAFLDTKKDLMPHEWTENADFNYELLESNEGGGMDYHLFNVSNNSAQSDFSPAFYSDDRILFSSGRPQKDKQDYSPSGESYLDIFVGKLNGNGDVQNSIRFAGIPASSFHKSTPYYSKALNEIFYVLSNTANGDLVYDQNGKNALAIGLAGQNGSFEYILKDLSTSFYYPFYDAKTQRLYFVANFDEGYGGTDIYYVNTNNGQIMSSPVNLGPRINSPGNEIAPYIFNNSLYFSSDVFYGLGGMDIYKSNIMGDDNFSIPINLGRGINSTADDFGFIIKDGGNGGFEGYFSSNRQGGKGKDDIYGFRISDDPGLKTLALTGTVTDPTTGEGIDKVAVSVLDTEGNPIKEVYSNEDGQYRFEIPWRDHIVLEIHKERYGTFKKKYDEKEITALEKNQLNIELPFLDAMVAQKEDKTVLKLKKIRFDRGKSTITPEAAMVLDMAVYALKEFPQIRLAIETYTDSRGASSTNLKISQNRADAIKNYLIEKGAPAKSILSSKGYGEEKILNNCTNGVYCLDMLHEQNNRSLLVVTNYDSL
ncbi:OmpA family protein [Flavobacteriaceae bacterium F89]|uniref:OmpA family protein n=1 Tax=Cerina litoralis TaxID=2874477 RepID=A0AAE3ESS0_9FLAO|nr:OmpA family protein [Cerina litoralis]MCG2459783.1 OmpA family protein [Cerina litoralis]